jgi:hypothetical protein
MVVKTGGISSLKKNFDFAKRFKADHNSKLSVNLTEKNKNSPDI